MQAWTGHGGAESLSLNFIWTNLSQGNFFPAHAGLITACLVGSFDASSGDFAILARLDQIIRIQGLFFFFCEETPNLWRWIFMILIHFQLFFLSLWSLQRSYRDELQFAEVDDWHRLVFWNSLPAFSADDSHLLAHNLCVAWFAGRVGQGKAWGLSLSDLKKHHWNLRTYI